MSDLVLQSIVVGLIAIISALVGGVLPQWIQNFENEKKLKREKLETLYIDIENWFNNAFNIFYLQFDLIFKGVIDWDGYSDICIKQKPLGTHKKSEMTICLYFNELDEEYKQLLKSVTDINKFINGEIRQAYIRGEDVNSFKALHQEKVDFSINNMKSLQDHIRNLAGSLSK